MCPEERLVIVDKSVFVNAARRIHPELSDDNLGLIYDLFRSEWSYDETSGRRNVFFCLPSFTLQVLEKIDKQPCVSFRHLFRWQQLSQLVGEDLLVCAYLAFNERYTPYERKDFGWPTILPSDDQNLWYDIRQWGFSELHQHLKASTDVFGISWVCLMNNVKHRRPEFYKIADERIDADELYILYIEAAAIRLALYRMLMKKDITVGENSIDETVRSAKLGDTTMLQASINVVNGLNTKRSTLDYACEFWGKDFDVFAGERRLIYTVLRAIYEGANVNITRQMYRYILIKEHIRERMVQINNNVGFANFVRFEERKEVFLDGHEKYSRLLKSLPLYEAHRQHGVKYAETRIAPKFPYVKLQKAHSDTKHAIEHGLGDKHELEWHLTYHFIKKRDKLTSEYLQPRNHKVRIEVRNQAVALRKLQALENEFVGIDAANSEMFCRPEVFAQAYRYLDDGEIKRTYHAGEDFYDLTDGLRTIDEAVRFLQLREGDRLGHCIALGIEPTDYYDERHWHVAVPRQVLLDNVVWLLYESKRYNVMLPPIVDRYIRFAFKEHSRMYVTGIGVGLPTMEDYYCSMMIRGNSPYANNPSPCGYMFRDWNSVATDRRKEYLTFWDTPNIKQLFMAYHYNRRVRKEGQEVIEVVYPKEFAKTLREMQDAMMTMLSKSQIAIEICPSSNVKIGRLKRYDKHPAFRFLPVDENGVPCPPVTINTDDLGIFTTSLDNEYALLKLAMMKQKDMNGNLKHSELQVRRWIETLIRNGNTYRFKH